MGYTTEFQGALKIEPEISLKHAKYINAFAEARHLVRVAAETATFDDPLRKAVGLPVGPDGAFYVGDEEGYDVIDHNTPPESQPGLYCQWVINDSGELEWDGGEKFYAYVEWLEYLITNFFGPWGYKLNGSIHYQGEEHNDRGTIVVEDNRVRTQ